MTKSIQALIFNVLNQKENWKLKLLSEWNIISGKLSHHVVIEKIDQQVVTLGVFNSCWLQEIYLLSAMLLENINTHLGARYVTKLQIRHVSQKLKKQKKIKPINDISMHHLPVSLPNTHLKVLEKISDHELQLVLKNFYTKCSWEKR